jgi:hypothetical protein
VPVTLHAGLRPWLGETLEAMTLVVDGEQVASWNLGGTTLEAAQPLVLTPGRHEYRLAGSYTWTDPGGRAATVPASGSGHVDVVVGGRLEVVYLPDGTFGLTAG